MTRGIRNNNPPTSVVPPPIGKEREKSKPTNRSFNSKPWPMAIGLHGKSFKPTMNVSVCRTRTIR